MKIVDLAIVTPIYNEEANIEGVVKEWIGELERLGITFVLLPINDGSKDGTSAALRKLAELYPNSVQPVDKQNAGHGSACRTGYSMAVERGATWTLQIDSDGQCDPQYFAAFWSNRDQADAVFGLRKSRDDGFMRALVSSLCRVATFCVCGVDLKDANVPYRLIRTGALKEALQKIPENFDMQNVALTLTLKRNPSLRWKYIPIHFLDRKGGTNSINLRRIMIMGVNLLANLHKVGG